MELSVVIPAYNEEKRIVATLQEILTFLEEEKVDYEVLVIDDGSKDNTRKEVMKFSPKVRLSEPRKNRGKGFTVKQGMLMAKKKWVLFMDADNSTSIKEMKKFFPQTENYDILIASRNLKESNIAIKQPWLRSTLGKGFPLFARILAVRGIKDTQCGFKLFSSDAVREIFPRSRLTRWGFDVELLFIGRKKGFKIKELPITWKNDAESKVNPFKDAIDMFLDLLRIRWNSLRGKYK